jgi:hypothetical protein
MARRKSGVGRTNDAVRAAQLAKVAELTLAGWTQQQIANKLRISRQQVHYDQKRLTEEWVKQAAIDTAKAKAIELAKLARIEREAAKGWERSLRNEETHVSETSSGGDKGDKTTERKTKRGQAGDAAFLLVACRVSKQRCEILGIKAPEKIEADVGARTIEVVVVNRPPEVKAIEGPSDGEGQGEIGSR